MSLQTTEHPFAQYVRILGKGKHTHRSLTREEAFDAFHHILSEKVEPIQLGAFLLLLRVKGETVDEMTGFASSARTHINAPGITTDIDWPSYAGKHKQQAWYLLAALLLAHHGHRIFMHGSTCHSAGRVYTDQLLRAFHIEPCRTWQDVEQRYSNRLLAYMPLEYFCPSLNRLFSYRELLGVRSPVNSMIKLVNPLRARLSLQSVFHPAYLEIHQEAARLLGHPYSLVMKGEGGELEFRPDADNRLLLLKENLPVTDKWLRTQHQRQADLPTEALHADVLQAVWSGTHQDSYGMHAIIGTAAVVLFGSGLAASEQEARQIAQDYWDQRNLKYLEP